MARQGRKSRIEFIDGRGQGRKPPRRRPPTKGSWSQRGSSASGRWRAGISRSAPRQDPQRIVAVTQSTLRDIRFLQTPATMNLLKLERREPADRSSFESRHSIRELSIRQRPASARPRGPAAQPSRTVTPSRAGPGVPPITQNERRGAAHSITDEQRCARLRKVPVNGPEGPRSNGLRAQSNFNSTALLTRLTAWKGSKTT